MLKRFVVKRLLAVTAALAVLGLTAGSAIASSLDAGLEGQDITQVVFHPTESGTIWAATSTHIYKTTNYGETWAISDSGMIKKGFKHGSSGGGDLAVSQSNPNILYAGTDRPYKSTDGGVTWQALDRPWQLKKPELGAAGGYKSPNYANTKVASVAISPNDPNRVYITSMGSYSFASADGGLTWPTAMYHRGSAGKRGNSISTYAYTLAVAPSKPNVIYAGTYHGVQRSADMAANWFFVTETFPKPDGGLMYGKTSDQIRVDPCDDRTVYVSRRDDRGKEHLTVTHDSGESWLEASTFPSPSSAYLVTVPGSSSLLYQWKPNVGLMQSDNGGATWSLYVGSRESISGRPAVDPTDRRRVAVPTKRGLKLLTSDTVRAIPSCDPNVQETPPAKGSDSPEVETTTEPSQASTTTATQEPSESTTVESTTSRTEAESGAASTPAQTTPTSTAPTSNGSNVLESTPATATQNSQRPDVVNNTKVSTFLKRITNKTRVTARVKVPSMLFSVAVNQAARSSKTTSSKRKHKRGKKLVAARSQNIVIKAAAAKFTQQLATKSWR